MAKLRGMLVGAAGGLAGAALMGASYKGLPRIWYTALLRRPCGEC